MLFSTTINESEFERMMTTVPRFEQKGHGVYIFERYQYTEKDCDCCLCLYYDKKKKCAPDKCPCIEERIEAAAVNYSELVKHLFSPCKNTAFIIRLKKYLTESEEHPMIYRGNAHRDIFKNALDKIHSNDKTMLSALYLLTADKYLWSKVKHVVDNRSIDFSAVHLGNVSPDAYTLFMAAKDLYCGTKHITMSDLADREIISKKMFAVLCNSMAIRRYGMKAVEIFEKDGDCKC